MIKRIPCQNTPHVTPLTSPPDKGQENNRVNRPGPTLCKKRRKSPSLSVPISGCQFIQSADLRRAQEAARTRQKRARDSAGVVDLLSLSSGSRLQLSLEMIDRAAGSYVAHLGRKSALGLCSVAARLLGELPCVRSKRRDLGFCVQWQCGVVCLGFFLLLRMRMWFDVGRVSHLGGNSGGVVLWCRIMRRTSCPRGHCF